MRSAVPHLSTEAKAQLPQRVAIIMDGKLRRTCVAFEIR